MARVEVRRARLADAEAIAAFVNAAQSGAPDRGEISRSSVVERFSQVGFMIAEETGRVVGLLGWQIENLIVRVTDYLVAASGTAGIEIARSLVAKMEAEAGELQAESVLLFLPAHPSDGLITFWEALGYDAECLADLGKACQEAVSEWGLEAERVMIKRLREDAVGRPI